MENADLAVQSAVQEIIEMLHLATDTKIGNTCKSLKLQIKTAEMEEENEACLFHLKLHSSSTNPEEFMSSLTRPRDSELLPVLSAMQFTEDESHLCVQYLQPPGLITQKSFQVRHSEDQSRLVLHCISTSTKSSKKPGGVSLHLRILLPKHLMMLECQKMYKYLWLFKIFNPKIELEFNMKIFENLCESELSCTPMDLSGSSLEICADTSFFLRNTSYVCTTPCLVPVCSEISRLSLCERIGDSSYPNSVSLQVVAHTNLIQGGGRGQHETCAKQGLVKMYLFGPEAVPVFPVLEDTQYNPLEQIPWNLYGLNCYTGSASLDDRFSSHFSALLESTVPQTQRRQGSKFVLFIHVHFGLDSQTTQTKLELCAWLHKNYHSILKDHQQEIDKDISQVVACLLQPHRETDKKTECYTKAIPNMVKSIAYVLSHSSNEEFRQHCFGLLSVNNSRGVESEVTNRLWDIASKRCGVRGQMGVRGHSPVETNSSKPDSVGCALTNPDHDEDSAVISSTDPEQEPAIEGGGKETSTEGCVSDGGQEISIRSSYTDLGQEMFTSSFIGQGQVTSAGFGFTDKGQETFTMTSFTDVGNDVSAEDGFTDGRYETIIGKGRETYAETITTSTSGFTSREHSAECRFRKIEHKNYTGNGFTVYPMQEAPTGSGFTVPGQETSAGSVFMMDKAPLYETDKNSAESYTSGFSSSNQEDSSWTEICEGSIGDHWSPQCPSQVHAPMGTGTQGRVYRESCGYQGYDDDESQGVEMFHPTDIGPSGDTFNHHGYPLHNINDSFNTGDPSQKNLPVANTDYFQDLGHHHVPIDNGQNYSFQGHDFVGQDHDAGAGESFDDVLENVQQWLDEF